MINTTIGKYKITRLIGEGGMAAVYVGEHIKLGTEAAIKVLNPILSANKQIHERFVNEAKLMASLNHPNIAKVIDYEETDNVLAIVMEFLEGEDLSAVIKKNGALPENEVMNYLKQSLSALDYAHSKGIVHRDIKPSNIFVLPDGRIKILDFGIAKLFGEGNEMTQTGTQIGTPIYMSPEQVKSDKSIDHRSDIYSLGVTMFYAINGKPPYDANTTSQFDIFNKIVYEPLPDLQGSGKFNELVKKACAKDKDQRFADCKQWLAALKANETTAYSINMVVENTGSEKTVVETPGTDKTILETDSSTITEKTIFDFVNPEEEKMKKSIKTPVENKIQIEKSTLKLLKKRNKSFIYSIIGILVIVISAGIVFFMRESRKPNELIETTMDFVDIEGNNYKTVKIGDQIWMAENLNTSTFRNGDAIPEAASAEEWVFASENQQPAWCWHPIDTAENVITPSKCGKLYNWYAVNDPRGLAPKGWKIPSDDEWSKLSNFLGGESNAGKKLKSTNGWLDGGNGTNESEFNGQPWGMRLGYASNGFAEFIGKFYDGVWWSSTQGGYRLSTGNSRLDCFYGLLGNGLSVRCMRY